MQAAKPSDTATASATLSFSDFTYATKQLVTNAQLNNALPDEAFLAGLIHDIGILVELQALREPLVEVAERATRSIYVQPRCFGDLLRRAPVVIQRIKPLNEVLQHREVARYPKVSHDPTMARAAEQRPGHARP